MRSTLRRNQEFREVSPLTGLPGNARIRREIADRMRAGADYAVCYIDIDRFKSVNDVYGFDRGDEFITALARSLHRAVVAAGLPPVFLGPHRRRRLRRRLHARPGAAADRAGGDRLREGRRRSCTTRSDAQRGYVEVTDRRGNEQPRRTWSRSRSGWRCRRRRRRFTDPREVIAVASEMKTVAKNQPGSYVAIDRRRSELRTTAVDRRCDRGSPRWRIAGPGIRARLWAYPPRAGGTR